MFERLAALVYGWKRIGNVVSRPIRTHDVSRFILPLGKISNGVITLYSPKYVWAYERLCRYGQGAWLVVIDTTNPKRVISSTYISQLNTQQMSGAEYPTYIVYKSLPCELSILVSGLHYQNGQSKLMPYYCFRELSTWMSHWLDLPYGQILKKLEDAAAAAAAVKDNHG